MKLYKNIDIVQINVKAGVREYFFPKNVGWADQVIENIVVYGSNPEQDEFSPIDGVTPIVDRDVLNSLYFDLYSDTSEEIVHSLNAQNLLYTNNNPIEINSKLSLQLSRIFFAEEAPNDGCLLLYVMYGNKDVENYDEPQKNVTVEFELPSRSELSLADVIDTYIYAQGKLVKGIQFWGAITSGAGVFLTLRNSDYHTVVNRLPVNMCRPPMGEDYFDTGSDLPAERVQAHPIYLDNEDIDFANSTIQYTWNEDSSPIKVKLTFLY